MAYQVPSDIFFLFPFMLFFFFFFSFRCPFPICIELLFRGRMTSENKVCQFQVGPKQVVLSSNQPQKSVDTFYTTTCHHPHLSWPLDNGCENYIPIKGRYKKGDEMRRISCYGGWVGYLIFGSLFHLSVWLKICLI